MAIKKRFIRSLNGAYGKLDTASKNDYVNSGSIIFQEDEKIITAWGKDYLGTDTTKENELSVTAGTDQATINLLEGTNGGTKSVVDSIVVKAGNDIDVTVDKDTITVAHETITTTFVPNGGPSNATTANLNHGDEIQLVSLAEVDNGHVTKLEFKKYKLPSDENTHYESKTIIGGTATATTDSTTNLTNGNVYQNHIENDSVKSTHKLIGNDEIDVTWNASNDSIVFDHKTPENGTAIVASNASEFSTSTKTFTAITELSKNANGHVTAATAKTFTLPDNAFNDTTYTLKGVANNDKGEILLDSTGTDSTIYVEGDGVIVAKSDADSVNLTHAQKGPSTQYTSGNTETSISGAGTSKTIKIPQLTVDTYGHVTAAADEEITITLPSVSDLGLDKAMQYIGKTTTVLSDGATTNPITIDSKLVTATQGNVVIDANDAKEYIWNGSKWEEFGNEGNYKVVQTAVLDPTKNGTDLDFIATISQDTQGVITATKKTVQTAGKDTLGVVKTTSTVTSTDGLTASPIINGVVYYKDTDTTYNARNGVRLDSGYFEADLVTETKSTKESTTSFNGTYANAVTMDKNGKLMVDSSADWEWEVLA